MPVAVHLVEPVRFRQQVLDLLSVPTFSRATFFEFARRMPVELQDAEVAGSIPARRKAVAQWQSAVHVSPLFVALGSWINAE